MLAPTVLLDSDFLSHIFVGQIFEEGLRVGGMSGQKVRACSSVIDRRRYRARPEFALFS